MHIFLREIIDKALLKELELPKKRYLVFVHGFRTLRGTQELLGNIDLWMTFPRVRWAGAVRELRVPEVETDRKASWKGRLAYLKIPQNVSLVWQARH